jgi:hypothetical protein
MTFLGSPSPDTSRTDAVTHLDQEAVLAGQGSRDPRPAPSGAGRTWPYGPCSPHRCAVEPRGHHIPAYRVDASTEPAASSAWVSGRMSIRHPVSLAASRAFCPSLPIARDNW